MVRGALVKLIVFKGELNIKVNNYWFTLMIGNLHKSRKAY